MGDGANNNVDAVLVSLGKYGRWQIYQCVLLCITFISTAFQYASIVFIGFVPPFVCDDGPNATATYFLNRSLVGNTNLSRYKLYGDLVGRDISSGKECDVWDSANNSSRPCETSFRYGALRQASIASEWDLICRWEYLVPLSQMILTVGLALGNAVLLPLADKYGRKRTLVTCHWIYLVISMLIALSPNIYVFIVVRFLIGFLFPGLHSVTILAIMELFPKKQMTSVSMFSRSFWALGIMLICPMAYLFRDVSWRYLQLALSMASLMVAVQTFFLDESVRWFLVVNRKKDAVSVIRKAARINHVDYERTIENLVAKLDFYTCIDIQIPNGEKKHLIQNVQLCEKTFPSNGKTSKAGCMDDTAASAREKAVILSNQLESRKLNICMENNAGTTLYGFVAGNAIATDDRTASTISRDDTARDLMVKDCFMDGQSHDAIRGEGLEYTELPTKDRRKLPIATETIGENICARRNHCDRHSVHESATGEKDNEDDASLNDEPNAFHEIHSQDDSSRGNVDEGRSMLILFKHRRLRMLTLSISYICTADILVYYGLVLLSPALAGNRFLNVGLNGAIEIPGYFLAMIALKRFSRKTNILWSHVLTGVMLAAATIVSVTEGPDMLVTALMTVARLGGSVITAITILYASEVFPTSIRGRAAGFCCGVAYAGAILSPLSIYLVQFGIWIPASVFVVLCVTVCILLIFLPETRGKQLPQTIADL